MERCADCGVTIREGQRSYYIAQPPDTLDSVLGSPVGMVVCETCYRALGSPAVKKRPLIYQAPIDLATADTAPPATCDVCGKTIAPGRLTLDIRKEDGGIGVACSDCYAKLERATVEEEESEEAINPINLNLAMLGGGLVATVIALVVCSMFPEGWGWVIAAGANGLTVIGLAAWVSGIPIGFVMRFLTGRHTAPSLQRVTVAVMVLSFIAAEVILALTTGVARDARTWAPVENPLLAAVILIFLLPLAAIWHTPGALIFWGITSVSAYVTVGSRMMAPVLKKLNK
jgi:hypothetical protein